MNRKVQLSEETSSQNNTVDKRNRGKIIQVVYIIAALDITWMFLQFSITPYLAKKLGFDTLWFGYLQTMVGFCQLFGGPLFGRFGDLFGARTALSVACSSSVVFFLLLAAANHPAMLFIHKLPTLLMHIIPTSQMVVTDLSEPDKRADALSKLGLCFGVGMIAGSTLGGHLNTRYGEKITACVGAAGSFFSLLLVLKFIPKNTKVHASTAPANAGSDKKTSIFSVDQITRLMKFPGVARTFIVKIAVSLPSGIFQVMFSIIALEFFKLQPEENGYLMAFFGIVQMANMQTVFQLCLTIIPMMFSLSMFNVITDSMLTKSVPSSDTGTMLGLCSSVQSLLRTVGPTIGGFLYVNFGLPSIGTVQFVMNAAVFTYLLRRHLKNTDEQKE
ncbi:hypothetical protein fugu_003045 [Takifugu bimaculatus]|uniref:Organic cation transporter-like protein 2 n=1 Tax=Takifugu bimaculatus TaxID=433685 RepID=A0A4Z2BGT1_9TELE|nr:hypothetical protein fugu_003045 [Takifugu bimaculatus]